MLDPSQFAFTRALEGCYDTFLRELDGLTKEDFQPWPLTGGYRGLWLVYPLFLFDRPPEMVVDFAGNQSRCPESMRAIEQMQRVRTASFSWLEPGSHILPHTDAYYDRLIRAHLGLRVPSRSLLRIDGRFLAVGEHGHLLWLDLTPRGAEILSRASLFKARETWALPVISRGLLYVTQNTRGALEGTGPRLLCYDMRAFD